MWRRAGRRIYNYGIAGTLFVFPLALIATAIWGDGPTPAWFLAWAGSLALLVFGRRFCLWMVKKEQGEVYFLTSVPTSDMGMRTGPEPDATKETGKEARSKGKGS